jgi:hypothetical protein
MSQNLETATENFLIAELIRDLLRETQDAVMGELQLIFDERQQKVFQERVFGIDSKVGTVTRLLNAVYEILERHDIIKSCVCRDEIILATRQRMPQDRPEDFKRLLIKRDNCNICNGTGWVNGGRLNGS